MEKLLAAMPKVSGSLVIRCVINGDDRVWKVEFGEYEGVATSVDEACKKVLVAIREHAMQLHAVAGD